MIDVPAGHLYLGGTIDPATRDKSDIRVTGLSLVWVPAG